MSETSPVYHATAYPSDDYWPFPTIFAALNFALYLAQTPADLRPQPDSGYRAAGALLRRWFELGSRLDIAHHTPTRPDAAAITEAQQEMREHADALCAELRLAFEGFIVDLPRHAGPQPGSAFDGYWTAISQLKEKN